MSDEGFWLDLKQIVLEGKNGAGERTRTADLLITNQLLYQLSYAGVRAAYLQRAAVTRRAGFNPSIRTRLLRRARSPSSTSVVLRLSTARGR